MSGKNVTAHDVMQEKNDKLRDQKYNDYVSSVTPKHSWFLNLCKAFLVGGIICVLGQALVSFYQSCGFDKETAGLYEVVTLVLISVLLTGFNIYSPLAKWAGAGTVVPITGFANSVASAAIEFKTEGQVFGIGCKIFTICGPVILYGITFTWFLGLIYWILKITGIV
nr:SpoVA/SpoVAEb family sporulation membrane protein [uncultured Lachnoclostridium sp.]